MCRDLPADCFRAHSTELLGAVGKQHTERSSPRRVPYVGLRPYVWRRTHAALNSLRAGKASSTGRLPLKDGESDIEVYPAGAFLTRADAEGLQARSKAAACWVEEVLIAF